MQDLDIQEMIGPSRVMEGAEIDLDEAIQVTREKFPGQNFCVVREWVWLDFEAPDLVSAELAAEGKKPVMLLVFDTLFDSSTSAKRYCFRTTPLIEFTDGCFFRTQGKLYVLLGPGRRRTLSLSTIVRMF